MIITTPISKLSPFNHRQYTADILAENIDRLTQAINERRLMGTFYCEDYYGNEFDLQRVSHLITGLAIFNDDLVANVKILETPCGKVLQYSINRGIKFRLGPVGHGILKEDNITFEEYTLERIDLIVVENGTDNPIESGTNPKVQIMSEGNRHDNKMACTDSTI